MKILKPLSSSLDSNNFSCKGFFNFLKENLILLFTSIFALFFIYSVRFSAIPFGVDTEGRLLGSHCYGHWMAIGRFGLVALQKILTNFLHGKELFNPFLSLFLAIFFLLFGTLLWCYLINFFANASIKKALFVPFAILLLSHQVWVEQIYFVLQSAECLFIYFLSPITVFLLFCGVHNAENKKILFGILLTAFCISVYQGILPLIFCGIFASFILFEENHTSNCQNRTQFCIILLFTMFLSVLLYLFANIAVQFFFNVKSSDYLTGKVASETLVATIIRFGGYIYTLIFGNFIPEDLLKKFIIQFAPTKMYVIETMSKVSLMATILIVPAIILFFVNILKSKNKSFFLIMAAISLFFCVIVLPLLGSGWIDIRTQYVLPFATAFLFLYVSSKMKIKMQNLCIILLTFIAIRQSLVCSMLNYSDVARFNFDVRLSQNIASRIMETGASENTPVFLYGKKICTFNNNFLKGEACGHSSFEWETQFNNISDCTSRGLAFMRTQGYKFTETNNKELIEKARNVAKNMQDFPHKDSVCNLGDIVVVRLSESNYIEK